MKVAKDKDKNINTGKNSKTSNKAEGQPSQNNTSKQTLDDLIKENGDYYNALNSFVKTIKQFETNQYNNFSDFGRNFLASFNAYLNNSAIKDEEKKRNHSYIAALEAGLNNASVETSKKKEYIQSTINQFTPALSAEYNKIKSTLTPEHYHNMAQRSLNDPMIMLNPFTNNLKQELSKNNAYGNNIKTNELLKDMENDLKNNEFSKLADYFQRIPYNRDAYKKLDLNDQQIDTLISSMDKTFRDISEDLKQDDKKRLMGTMASIISNENNTQFSDSDKKHAANSFSNANPDPMTGLYLALNSSRGAINPGSNGMNAENIAKMLGVNPYSAGPDMGLGY